MRSAYITLLVVLIAGAISDDACMRQIRGKDGSGGDFTVTYDLSPIRAGDQWILQDSDLISRNYTYQFNICKDVMSRAKLGDACDSRADGTLYPAYQIDNASGGCYRLSNGENTRWSAIDNDDPSVGVVYHMRGGSTSFCNDGNGRTLRLEFYCMNNPVGFPTSSIVTEYPQCTYNMKLESMYGCPVSCGESDHILCGGKGVCGYDRDKGTTRCFCNTGYYGSACEKMGDELHVFNDTSYALFAVCGFLILVEIGVLIMWRKVKGLRLDPSAYANLNTENMGMVNV